MVIKIENQRYIRFNLCLLISSALAILWSIQLVNLYVISDPSPGRVLPGSGSYLIITCSILNYHFGQ